jgi:preprotein translocase subunit SecA
MILNEPNGFDRVETSLVQSGPLTVRPGKLFDEGDIAVAHSLIDRSQFWHALNLPHLPRDTHLDLGKFRMKVGQLHAQIGLASAASATYLDRRFSAQPPPPDPTPRRSTRMTLLAQTEQTVSRWAWHPNEASSRRWRSKGVTDDRTVAWAKAQGIDPEELLPIDPVRGEKLKLDAPDDVLEEGGLQIIGSERHDSRRIDRQLRGRSGRQGDPGATQFYLSLEDDLMRLFGSERIANVMDRWGAEEGEVITHGLVTKSIERAQKRVETNNFEARKRLLDYDDVMNQQREVIYDLRLFALEGGEDLKGEIWEMIEHAAQDMIAEYMPAGSAAEDWDLAGLRRRLLLDFFLMIQQLPEENDPDHEIDREEVEHWVTEGLRGAFHKKLESLGEHAEQVTSFIMLSVIDDKWKDHLYDLDHLKASIGFRGWGQKDPLVEYKQEAYEMFVDLMTELRKTVASYFYRAQFGPPQQRRPMPQRLAYSGPSDSPGEDHVARAVQRAQRSPVGAGAASGRDELGMSPRASGSGVGLASGPDPRRLATNRDEAVERRPVSVEKEPGRNDPCPCGSGKKYKKCCGK